MRHGKIFKNVCLSSPGRRLSKAFLEPFTLKEFYFKKKYPFSFSILKVILFRALSTVGNSGTQIKVTCAKTPYFIIHRQLAIRSFIVSTSSDLHQPSTITRKKKKQTGIYISRPAQWCP